MEYFEFANFDGQFTQYKYCTVIILLICMIYYFLCIIYSKLLNRNIINNCMQYFSVIYT